MIEHRGSNSAHAKLDGLRVLVVEDEYFIADELRQLLIAHGADVVGPASDTSHARALLAASDVDCAVLDVDLNGLAVFPIVETLRQRDIPWVYVTGYSGYVVPETLHGHAHIEKPIVSDALVAALIDLSR